MCPYREVGSWLPECTAQIPCQHQQAGAWNPTCSNELAKEPVRIPVLSLLKSSQNGLSNAS